MSLPLWVLLVLLVWSVIRLEPGSPEPEDESGGGGLWRPDPVDRRRHPRHPRPPRSPLPRRGPHGDPSPPPPPRVRTLHARARLVDHP